jgi:nucleoside-diphosphate-sugar epimerase
VEGYSKVLVTGGTGFIGSHLVDRLMKEGCEVVVLDNLSSGRIENVKHHLNSGRFRLSKGDVRSSEDVKKAVKNVDAVFHLAAIVSVPLSIENPILVNDVNLRGTLNLLKASSEADVKRFTYISSCAVYGEVDRLPIDERCPTNPISPYAVSKLAAEYYCKVFCENYGLDTLCFRYFNVYGPRQVGGSYGGVITQFISRLKQRKPPIIYGDGQQTRDFVFINDVVEADMLALKCRHCSGETINVGTGKPTTISELASLLMEFFGQTHVKPVYKAAREGDIRNSQADISKAERTLGYKPKTTLKEGIRMLLTVM